MTPGAADAVSASTECSIEYMAEYSTEYLALAFDCYGTAALLRSQKQTFGDTARMSTLCHS
jgi:hypothetical protein